MLAVFLRPNGDQPRGERGGDSVVPPESWRKKLWSENRTKSTSLAEGLTLSMNSMRRASASVSRLASGPFEGVSPLSDITGVASSRRRSVLRRSTTKSKLGREQRYEVPTAQRAGPWGTPTSRSESYRTGS
jgi:hypothetical protein